MKKKLRDGLISGRKFCLPLITVMALAIVASPAMPGSPDSISIARKTDKIKNQALKQQGKKADARYKAGEVLVLMTASTTKGGKDRSHDTISKIESVSAGKVRKRINIGQDKQIAVVVLPAGKTVEQAIVENWVSKASDILKVEPNWRINKMVTPNDPKFSSLWGLNNAGQSGGSSDADIDAPEAWNISTGSPDIVVGIIDTGLDYLHPDLTDNVWTNSLEASGIAGIDDDGNGYIDDIHGYDFAMDDGDPMDANGHGTHVAGTIAAVGNNNLGVVGVNWHCKVMACRFMDASGGGWTSDAIDAINYAVANGARVLNNSWGGGGYSSFLEDAIQNAGDNGVLFVAAAGNNSENNDVTETYPANYEIANVVAVAATNRNDNLSYFSNYGQNKVHLAAPGESIQSTIPVFIHALSENFDSATTGGFTGTAMTATGSWSTILSTNNVGSETVVAVTDENSFPYTANNNSYLISGPIDTRGMRGLSVGYLFNSNIYSGDSLQVEVWDGSNWVTIGEIGESTDTLGYWFDNAHDIPDACRNAAMQIRFHWRTDSVNNEGYGLKLDDVVINYIDDNYTNGYQSYSGTSMATPHVSGAAALLLATNPAMSISELKSRLISGCDPISGLSTSVMSGGRLNAFNSVTLPDGLTVNSPTGGEIWVSGYSYPIRWSSVGGQETVSINLINDAGSISRVIAQNIPDTGTFQWTITPDIPTGSDYRIVITEGSLSSTSPSIFTIAASRDYLTELFELDNFDLQNTRIMFSPSGNGYTACVEQTNVFNTDTTGSTSIILDDDNYQLIDFDETFSFYGQSYNSCYVGSNGYITFGSGNNHYEETLENHFAAKRISALFHDLEPNAGGSVSARKFADHMAVTWQSVPEYGMGNHNTFQIEMYYDGRIAITWLEIDSTNNLVGLSDGAGTIPPDYQASDLSEYNPCSGCHKKPTGDLNKDCQVNIEDMALLLTNWLVNCENDPQAEACR